MGEHSKGGRSKGPGGGYGKSGGGAHRQGRLARERQQGLRRMGHRDARHAERARLRRRRAGGAGAVVSKGKGGRTPRTPPPTDGWDRPKACLVWALGGALGALAVLSDVAHRLFS